MDLFQEAQIERVLSVAHLNLTTHNWACDFLKSLLFLLLKLFLRQSQLVGFVSLCRLHIIHLRILFVDNAIKVEFCNNSFIIESKIGLDYTRIGFLDGREMHHRGVLICLACSSFSVRFYNSHFVVGHNWPITVVFPHSSYLLLVLILGWLEILEKLGHIIWEFFILDQHFIYWLMLQCFGQIGEFV